MTDPSPIDLPELVDGALRALEELPSDGGLTLELALDELATLIELISLGETNGAADAAEPLLAALDALGVAVDPVETDVDSTRPPSVMRGPLDRLGPALVDRIERWGASLVEIGARAGLTIAPPVGHPQTFAGPRSPLRAEAYHPPTVAPGAVFVVEARLRLGGLDGEVLLTEPGEGPLTVDVVLEADGPDPGVRILDTEPARWELVGGRAPHGVTFEVATLRTGIGRLALTFSARGAYRRMPLRLAIEQDATSDRGLTPRRATRLLALTVGPTPTLRLDVVRRGVHVEYALSGRGVPPHTIEVIQLDATHAPALAEGDARALTEAALPQRIRRVLGAQPADSAPGPSLLIVADPPDIPWGRMRLGPHEVPLGQSVAISLGLRGAMPMTGLRGGELVSLGDPRSWSALGHHCTALSDLESLRTRWAPNRPRIGLLHLVGRPAGAEPIGALRPSNGGPTDVIAAEEAPGWTESLTDETRRAAPLLGALVIVDVRHPTELRRVDHRRWAKRFIAAGAGAVVCASVTASRTHAERANVHLAEALLAGHSVAEALQVSASQGDVERVVYAHPHTTWPTRLGR